MKFSISRSIAVLAVVLGLAACGSTAMFDVKGTIVGLEHPGLELINNGEEMVIPAKATSFKFTKRMEYGEKYTVTFGNQPDHQTCTLASSSGDSFSDVAGRLSTIDVYVKCVLNQKNVVVTLNKPAPGLVLNNGSDATFALTDTSTTANFPVAYGKSYGITVLKQPTAGGVCTVQNGSGVMGDDDKNVTVTCP